MNHPVRLGMIGCGLISHAHGRASLKSRDTVRFVACASRNAGRAAGWAREYHCAKHYTDYADMLREETLDGVVIATWPADHRAHIEAALNAGIRNVLCEKALTVSSADALAIWEAAQAAGGTVVEGFMYRYHPAMDRLRELLDRAQIGDIDSIRGVFHMYRPGAGNSDEENWRLRPKAGGGVAYDFTCYPVDAVNMLADGLPLRVTAVGTRVGDEGVLTRLAGIIEYDSGIVGFVDSSHNAGFSQALEIAGSEGHLAMPVAWSIRDEAIIVHSRSDIFLELSQHATRIPQPAAHDGRLIDLPVFQLQLERFAAAIRGTAAPGVRLAESVVNAIVIEALVESAGRRRAVDCVIPPAVQAALTERERP
jgi:predicted dehydrogenase